MKQLYFYEIARSVNLDEPKFVRLVVENPKTMRKYVGCLFDGLGDNSKLFGLTEEGKPLYLDEHVFFLPNPFCLELNSKRNVNALIKILKKSYFDNLAESVKDIQKRIEEAVDLIKLDFDVEIVSDFCLKTDDLFKIANVKFSEECENHVERLCRFLAVENELHSTSILFTVGLFEYFESNEIEGLMKELFYRGLTVIDIESNTTSEKLENEIRMIIDHDLCAI